MMRNLLIAVILTATSAFAQTTHVSTLCNVITDGNPTSQPVSFSVYVKDHSVSNLKAIPVTQPKRVIILQDMSGSIKEGNTLALSLQIVRYFVSTSPTNEQLQLIDFSSDSFIESAMEDAASFSKDFENLVAEKKFKPKGRTAVFDAIAASIENLSKDPKEGDSLFIISDGGDNASSLNAKKLRERVRSHDVRVYLMALLSPGYPGEFERRKEILEIVKESGGLATGTVPTNAREIWRYSFGPQPDPAYDGTPAGLARLKAQVETVHQLIQNPHKLEFDVTPPLTKLSHFTVAVTDAQEHVVSGYNSQCPYSVRP